MFPRRFWPGRYFGPRYWPQSQGDTPVVTVHMVIAGIEIDARVGGTVTMPARVGGTVELGG